MSGWYKQQRNIPERAWFKNAEAVQLYTFLKATAYVTDGPYQGQVIRRGSCPTTRAEMMEATGLSYKKVDSCLKILIAYGEIIVNGNSRFTVITICDYDTLTVQNDIFDAYLEQQENNQGDNRNTATGIATGTTPNISNKKEEERNKEYLISPYSPYKTERETRDMVLEIKKRYNKLFDGKLPPLLRLHIPTRQMVETCVKQFGLQSVDVVFAQVLKEPFSLGKNKTGFLANFQFIFEPRNFQQYLERAMLAKKKDSTATATAPNAPAQPEHEETAAEREERIATERKKLLQSLVSMAEDDPDYLKRAWSTQLLIAYKNGELQRLGIEWNPNKTTTPKHNKQ